MAKRSRIYNHSLISYDLNRTGDAKRISTKSRPSAVIDFETDPFCYGRIPEPFAAGFYDGKEFRSFWGRNCASELCAFLETLPAHTIYAHNGGKFDFHFLLERLQNPLRIIRGRIVKAKLGKHELRDSFAILPIPLKTWQKDDIDYAHMESHCRERYKSEILDYLRTDCLSLHEIVSAFIDEFGKSLTIGATAIKELGKFHGLERQAAGHDAKFRPFYIGGRVQCFRTGIQKGNWRVYDVNSMYPFVMGNYPHPIGADYETRPITKRDIARGELFFGSVRGVSLGAFPTRNNAGINYAPATGEFPICSHELYAGLSAGKYRFSGGQLGSAHFPARTIRFSEFVAEFAGRKSRAKLIHDKAAELFAKLILNSAYGKFGSNPENYCDYLLWRPGDYHPGADWTPHTDMGNAILWERPARITETSYYDVATAASITSAARSVLLTALSKATNPVYCDTDSIICEDLQGVPISPVDLGAWKLEAEGDTIAIAGKKLYALTKNGVDIKIASKGVRFTGKEITRLCKGDKIEYQHDAPSFSLSGTRFVKRTVKATGTI